MKIFIKILINAIAVFISARILPHVSVPDLYTAILVAIILGAINTFIKPILTILTLPLTILTFGLFSIILNAIIIMFASSLIKEFIVDGFIWAILFSIVLSIVGSILNFFF